jgi:ribonuclease HIII
MVEKWKDYLVEFRKFVQEKNWQIVEEKDINHACQVTVNDGTVRLPVNFFHTGTITTQGKPCETKTAITEWANLLQSGIGIVSADSIPISQNRISKYSVSTENFDKIREIIHSLPGEVLEKEISGPADVYRIENKLDGNRVTISQFKSGTLMVQGLSSILFDSVCDILDPHLTQTFSERAARYLLEGSEKNTATVYLNLPNSENESTQWLLQHIDKNVLDFLHENDRQTLLAAAGVRNAFQKTTEILPDYSVVVMPFAKSYEGFLTRLSIHLGLTTADELAKTADEIVVGGWLKSIKERIPDPKRYGDISSGLDAAWNSRHKAVHSDAFNSLSVLKAFVDAEDEISTILRAIKRAYIIFVKEERKLSPPVKKEEKVKATLADINQESIFENVDREKLRDQLNTDGYQVVNKEAGRKNEWGIIQKPDLTVIAPKDVSGRVIVAGQTAREFCEKYHHFLKENIEISNSKIGVDESGKGDLFGPLVVAGVIVNLETEILLAKRGVRDSKSLSDTTIILLADFIREQCPVEVLILLPPEYNALYEKYGNLNLLLAWGHAQVISKLSKKQKVVKAISDQFGDESLVINALKAENCEIALEQRPRAESDIAVAAASIIARSEFVLAMKEYTVKAGIEIPLGASAAEVTKIGREIFKRWGKLGIERIAKMHFKPIQEIMSEKK